LRAYYLVLFVTAASLVAAGRSSADTRAEKSPNDGGAPVAEFDMTVSPTVVEVRTFSRSADGVEVTGRTPGGCDVVVRVTCEGGSKLQLQYQRKVAGLFWFPAYKAELVGAPGFLGVYASGDVREILSNETRYRLGVEANSAWLRRQVEINDKRTGLALEATLAEEFLTGFITQRRLAGLYVTSGNAVTVSQGRFRLHMPLPKDAPTADYTVNAWAVRDGDVAAHAQGAFRIEAAGLAAWVENAASEHPWLYGIGCTLMSIAFGLLLGSVFRLRGTH